VVVLATRETIEKQQFWVCHIRLKIIENESAPVVYIHTLTML